MCGIDPQDGIDNYFRKRDKYMATQLVTKRTFAGATAVALLIAGVGLIEAIPASAAVSGTEISTTATGTDLSVTTFHTSAQCSTSGENLVVGVYGGSGSGVVAAGGSGLGKNINGAASSLSYLNGTTGGMDIGASQSWNSWAGSAAISQLSGTYTIIVKCQTSGDTFTGHITFTPNAGTGLAATYVTPIDTITTLALSAASPINFGAAETLTASVGLTAAEIAAGVSFPSGQPSGSIAFRNSATTLGSSALSTGSATFNASPLGAATYSLTAVYTPDSTATADGIAPTGSNATSGISALVINPSTSTTTVTIEQPTGTPVTTAKANTSVLVKATISPSAAPGSVQFTITDSTPATVNLGGVATVSGGVASYSWSIPAGYTQGAYTIGATYTASGTNVTGSSATPVAFTVGAPDGTILTEPLSVTLPVGSLTATVSSNSTVLLGTPAINATGTYFVATGAIYPLSVTDTRAGDTGWTVSAAATDFASGITPSVVGELGTISAHNLGLVPALTLANVANTNITSSTIAADHIVPTGTSVLGLSSAINIVSAAAGYGLATNTVNGALTLNIPTRNVPGTYTSTLTLTVLPL